MRLAGLALLLVMLSRGADFGARYAAQIEGLDLSTPESVCQARATLRSWMPQADTNDRAAMFRSFRALYLKAVLYTGSRFTAATAPFAGEIVDWFGSDRSPDAVRKRIQTRAEMSRALAPWFNCGFSLSEGEGELYPAPDGSTLLEFADSLPADLADYVRFLAPEEAEPVVGDAAIMVPLDRLGDRLARWESFARKHPQLPETKSEVEPEIHRLAWFCFLGVENTPIWDSGTGQIRPEAIEVWRRQAAKYPDSRFRPLASELVTRLTAHGGKLSENERELFGRYGLDREFQWAWQAYEKVLQKLPQ